MPNTHSTLTSLFSDIADSIRGKTGGADAIVADEFPEAIDSIPTGGGDITTEPLSIIANGTYTAPSGKAYTPVTVNVPQEEPVLDTLSVTENGTYAPETGTDGFDTVIVNVPNPSTGTINITENGTYDVTEKASAVVNVSGGGGGIPEHGVFFIDYDGSIVEAWASNEVASKTALPNNPTHTGLVAQGWNWTLSDIKSYIVASANANVYVGQMYRTVSGLTEMDITVTKVTGLTVTCKMGGNKDWGDGTANSDGSHTYTDYGNYTITCDGTVIPVGTSSSGGMFGSSSSNQNGYWCTAIRIGGNVTSVRSRAFYYCYALASITIPQGVTSIESNAFSNCNTLSSITIPQGVTSIESNAFYNCYTLANIAIPQGVTSIESNAFSGCYVLTSITIPQEVTSIGSSVFSGCYVLTSITIPQEVTSIGSSAFSNCYALARVTIPQEVTSIGSSAFSNCRAVTEYNFSSATAIPTLANINAFTSINGLCKIIVPDALYNDWITATNWATYANYIYKASEVG